MKHTILLPFLLLFVMVSNSLSQVNFNLTKVGELEYSQDINDIWGYEDENGEEYAILGTRTGTAIIALDGPEAPKEIEFIPGTSSTWRDMKSFGERVYVTTDVGEDGLLIIDMSLVSEDSISHYYWQPNLVLDGEALGPLNKCHNIYADESGYAYLSGCNVNNGGVLIFDLMTNPDTPNLVGTSASIYAHDCFTRDNILFTCDIYAGEFSMYDVSDKTNPQFIASQSTSANFTHNVWSSDDNQYAFTTDERTGAFVDAYDINDPDNIKRLDTWHPEDAFSKGIIPHNTHFHEGYLVTSWYTAGAVVLDASQPDNLVLVGQYHTIGNGSTGFNGAWGAYPYLPSGRVLVSDINFGLFVFEPNYVRAARIEGIVTDFITGSALSNVEVIIHDTIETTTSSGGDGFYKTGTAEFGELVVSYHKNDYNTHYDTISLSEGQNVMNDVQLMPNFNFYEWDLTIRDSSTLSMIEGGKVNLIAEDGTVFEHITDGSGHLTQPLIPEGTYDVYIGKWGYEEQRLENVQFTENRSDTVDLARGYRDFFNLDLDWSTDATASTGFWTRAIPVMTEFDGRIANPGNDSGNDFGDFAYVTGNNAGGAGFDDVDDGSVILISPWMDLSNYAPDDIQISFDYWFFADGGSTMPDDSMIVHIESPEMDSLIVKFNNSRSEWSTFDFSLLDHWAGRRDSLRIVFTANDLPGNGHVVEAGIDAFQVQGEQFPVKAFTPIVEKVNVYPNPTSEYIYFNDTDIHSGKDLNIQVINMEGAVVRTIHSKQNSLYVGNLPEGIYLLDISSDGKRYSAQFAVNRP